MKSVLSAKVVPSFLYQPFNGFGNASTIHCKRTFASTGDPTKVFGAFTDGETDKR